MRFYETRTPFEEYEFSNRLSTVTIIIIANIAVFVSQFISQYADINTENYLGLVPAKAVSKLWLWQFLTYNFLHSTLSVFHIIINMLLLFMFGREIDMVWGRRKFLITYLACGIYGGLCYCVYQYIAGSGAILYPAIGASAAVMGIMVIFALMWPNTTILFFFLIPMKGKYAVLLCVAIDLFYTMSNLPTRIANAAHLGGAACGYLIYKLEPVVDSMIENMEKKKARARFLKAFELQKEVDKILEKINKEGMQSLTNYEKNILKRASKVLSEKGAEL